MAVSNTTIKRRRQFLWLVPSRHRLSLRLWLRLLLRSSMLAQPLLLLLGFLLPPGAAADNHLATTLAFQIDGEAKVQEVLVKASADSTLAAQDDPDFAAGDLTLRLKAEAARGAWLARIHYLLEASHSANPAGLTAGRLPEEERAATSVFDLEAEISRSEHRLDRAYLGFTGDRWVFRLGRQAITWGNGLVFHPLDLFNPFSPDAKDTSYKPGTDLLYGQYLFASGADLQLLLVPRKRNASGELSAGQSSGALKYRYAQGALQGDLLLARDFDDRVFGVGLAGPLRDALWRLDLVPVWKGEGGQAVSLVANLQHSWSWGARPVTGYVEYYRNGYAASDTPSLSGLDFSLRKRLARGQLFALGRDYLSLGLQVQTSPLLVVTPTLIANLTDSSVLALLSGSYNLGDASNLVFGLQLPSGGRNSEFGGLETAPDSGQFATPAKQLFIRWEWFF